jgi:hypothetical protein
MCRPGVSRLHMFPLKTDAFFSPFWPGRPRQCFSTSCKLELPLFLCYQRPHRSVPLDQPASGLRVRRRPKAKKRIMCIAEDASHCPSGHHQRPVPSEPEGYIRQWPGAWGGGLRG